MTLGLDHDDSEGCRSKIVGTDSKMNRLGVVPSFRHHALARPWTAWPRREDVTAPRPGGRWLVLALWIWAAGTLTLAAATILRPSSASLPEPVPLRGNDIRQDYAAITERPLFAKTRHPPVVPIFVPPPLPARDRAISLKGIFLNGSDARAFLTSGTEPQGRWLAMNDMIAGWTIASVKPDEIRLTADGEMLTVALHPPGQSVAAPPPRALVPSLPRPVPPPTLPSRLTNSSVTEPGQRPDVQEPQGGVPSGLLGLGVNPAPKTP